jgi:hypothetical protein
MFNLICMIHDFDFKLEDNLNFKNKHIKRNKNKNKAKKHGSLIRLHILSRAVLCSVSQLEWPPAFASNGGREFVTYYGDR